MNIREDIIKKRKSLSETPEQFARRFGRTKSVYLHWINETKGIQTKAIPRAVIDFVHSCDREQAYREGYEAALGTSNKWQKVGKIIQELINDKVENKIASLRSKERKR